MSATAVLTGSAFRGASLAGASFVPQEPVATTSGMFGTAPYYTTAGPVDTSAMYHDVVRPVYHEVVREIPGREIIEQQTIIQYVPEIVETEKVVEIPQFNLQYMEEEVVQKLTHEKVVEVEMEQTYDCLCEEAVVEYQEVVKEVSKAVFEPREVIVEVPHVLHKEVLVEVPQVQIVDLIRQVPREQRQRKVVHVGKPVVQYREKIVQVPVTTVKEQLVEVPTVQQVEFVRQVPGPQEVQQVEKQVEKQVYEVYEAVQEVPMVETQEQVVEVTTVEVREVVKQVPKVEVQYIDKQVPKVEYNYVEKIVEVPHIIYEERIIEVPEVEVREVVRQVPKPIIKYVDKVVPKQEFRYFERIVDAPFTLQVERPVEVPQVEIIETIAQVPKPVTQFVDKEVKKFSIELREVYQEVDIVLQQEQAVEILEVQTVDTVMQVSAPYTEYRDKPVPAIETQVRERLMQVPHLLTKEKFVEIPQVQYVDIVQEEPTYDVREVLKEVPRYTVDYRHTVEEVSQQFVGAAPAGTSFLSQSMGGGNMSMFEREPPSVITAGPMVVATPVTTSMGVPVHSVVSQIPMEPTTVTAGYSAYATAPGMVISTAPQMEVQRAPPTTVVAPAQYVSTMPTASTAQVNIMASPPIPMEPTTMTTGYSVPGTTTYTTGPSMVISGAQQVIGGVVPGGMVVSTGGQYITGGVVGTAPGHGMSIFDALDQNHDGVLTREEFAAGVGGTAMSAPVSSSIVTAAPQYVVAGTMGQQVVVGGTAPSGVSMVSSPGTIIVGSSVPAAAQGVMYSGMPVTQYATGPVQTTTIVQDGQPRMVMQEPTTFAQAGPVSTVVAPAQYMVPTPVATSTAMPMGMGAYPAGSAGAPGVGYSLAMQGLGGMAMQGGLLKAGSITDDVFNMVDRNNDGVISRSEFRGALKGNVISATPNTRLAISQQHQQAGLGQ